MAIEANAYKPEVAIRPVTMDDLDFVYRCEQDCRPGIDTVEAESRPTRFMLWRFLTEYRHSLRGQGQLLFVITNGDAQVGTLEVTDYDPKTRTASVGIYISPRHRRHGYARKALSEAARILGNSAKLRTLTATVAHENTASRILFATAGFENTAEGVWILPLSE